MSSFKILYNPASRGGKSRKKVDSIVKKLDDLGLDYKLENTKGPKIGMQQAASAKEEGYTAVIAMGGDGTVHEIANGAIRAGMDFGVIPLGSGNDFASAIGINTWEDGINSLNTDNIQKISYLRINEHYSVNVLDAGLGAEVVKLSERSLKWIAGSLKYTLLTLRKNLTQKRYNVSIEIDGVSKDYDMNVLACGFGQTFGSGMNILPDARFNQDKMHIAIIHGASKFKVMRILPKVFTAEHINYTDYVDMKTGSKIKVISNDNDDMYLEGEGEIFGKIPFEAEVVSRGLPVYTPENWDLSNRSSKMD